MQREGGEWQLQLRIPSALAPLTLAYVIRVPGGASNAADQTITPQTGGHFCVPVGMRPGCATPLGAHASRCGAATP